MNTFSFRAGHRWLIALVLVLCRLSSWGQATMTTVLTNGPTSKRINIVLLSEGYKANELAQFRTDATNTANALLTVPPFDGFKPYFNAYAIAVASVDSGSDHPGSGIYRNTYFNSSYESYGTPQLLTIPPNNFDTAYANGQAKVTALLNQFMPEWDIVVLIVNDTGYGGAGGQYMTVSKNSSSAEIARHELGHSFAGLGDEYSTPYPGYPAIEEPNTTRQTNRNLIKWNAWINAGTPVPTPSGSTAVGLFAGAHYNATGWFRPKNTCRMKVLGSGYCEVCQEALVKSIYSRMGTIQGQTPTSLLANLVAASSTSFSVETPAPKGRSLQVRWKLNGVSLASTATNLVLNAAKLPPGTNTLTVDVTDTTALVRTDLLDHLHDSKTWQVVVGPNAPLQLLALSSLADGGGGVTGHTPDGGGTGTGAPLRILAPVLLADGRMVFSVSGDASNGFQIQASSNFVTWTDVFTAGPLHGGITVTNALQSGDVVGFRTKTIP